MEDYPFISLNLGSNYRFYHAREIMYCKSEGSYTKIFLENGKTTTSAKKLKELEQMFPDEVFARVHHSCIVNMMYITKYVKADSNQIKLTNGDEVSISRRKTAEFLARFLQL